MSRATRRIIVAHLTDHGMNPAEIAAELKVSPDTVRRDLRDHTQPAPTPDPEPAAPAAAGLLLPDHPQTRRNLELLTTALGAQPEDAARYAIHQEARRVRHWQTTRTQQHPRRAKEDAPMTESTQLPPECDAVAPDQECGECESCIEAQELGKQREIEMGLTPDHPGTAL
ncbi:winged helix-turn-helix domain-containing protein [Streptomyces sp. NPDC004610]|uniref:winged helix-turn-helix domain-containing protein n=1 Tax=unclassified Streptomyces TaxID=2593676 RepID=UPI0033A1EA95